MPKMPETDFRLHPQVREKDANHGYSRILPRVWIERSASSAEAG